MTKEMQEQLNKLMKDVKHKQSVFRQDANSLDIYIYGSIYRRWGDDDPDTDASYIQKLLKDHEDVTDINVYINSGGGSVFEGIAIYNQLKRASAKVHVIIDGLAGSIASVIAMAGDDISMPKSSRMMIHNCYTYAMGNAKELRKVADDLDNTMEMSRQIYLNRAGDNLTLEKLNELLDAESWLTAEQCVEFGLADSIIEDQTNDDDDEEDDSEQKALEQYKMFVEMMNRYNAEQSEKKGNKAAEPKKENRPKQTVFKFIGGKK